MNNKERRDYEESLNLQEDSSEGSAEEIAHDMDFNNKRYPSDTTPQDFYQYKKFRSDPDAKVEFSGKIDKDVVFANLSGSLPNPAELNFRLGTINLFKSVFLDGAETQEDQEAFLPVFNMILGEYKFYLVSSRAQGNEREAVLDNMTSIKKELSKKKEASGKTFGLGG